MKRTSNAPRFSDNAFSARRNTDQRSRVSYVSSTPMSQSGFNASRLSTSLLGTQSEVKKDLHTLQDKNLMQSSITRIVNFLLEEKFPQSNINAKMLQQPKITLVVQIFEFLGKFLQPDLKFENKFEEDIPKFLKSVRCPYMVTKLQLLNVAAKTNWPFALASLNWLVAAAKIVKRYDSNSGVDDPEAAYANLELDAKCRAYNDFLKGKDNHDEIMDEFREAALNLVPKCDLMSEIEALRAENEKLEKEIQEKSARQQGLNEVLASTAKLRDYNCKLEELVRNNRKLIATKEAELLECEKTHANLRQEYSQLREQVSNQAMSVSDAEKKAQEMEAINRRITALEKENSRLDHQTWELQVDMAREHDKLTTAELKMNSMVHGLPNELKAELGIQPDQESFEHDVLLPHLERGIQRLKGRCSKDKQVLAQFERAKAEIEEELERIRRRVNSLQSEAKADTEQYGRIKEERNKELEKIQERLVHLDQQISAAAMPEGSKQYDDKRLEELRKMIKAEEEKFQADREEFLKVVKEDDRMMAEFSEKLKVMFNEFYKRFQAITDEISACHN